MTKNAVILTIVTLLVAILIFIGNIGVGGLVGSFVCDILFGIFGFCNYIFPFILIAFLVYFFISRDESIIKSVVLFSVLFIVFTLFSEIISGIGKDFVNNPIEAFEVAKTERIGGGFIGSLFNYGISAAFGKVGAVIISVFALIITLFFMFQSFILNKLFSESRNRGNKAKKRTTNRDRKEERREERRKKRAERYAEENAQFEEFEDIISQDYESVQEDDIPEEITKKSIINTETKGSLREAFAQNIDPQRLNRMEKSHSGIDFTPLNSLSGQEGMDNISESPIEEVPLEPVVGDHIKIDPLPIPDEYNPLPEPESIEEDNPDTDTTEELFPNSKTNTENDISPVTSPWPEPFSEVQTSHSEGQFAKTEEEPTILESVKEEETPISEPAAIEDPIIFESSVTENEEPPISEPIIEEESPVFEPVTEEEPPVFEPITVEEEPPVPELVDVINEPSTIEPIETEEPSVTESEEVEDEIKPYIYPTTDLLTQYNKSVTDDSESLNEISQKLVNTLSNFGVDVTVSDISRGPAVTRFELIPSQGVKVSKILNLSDDIKLNLAAADIRMEAPIPGKSAVGIEVPNKNVDVVHFRELIESESFINNNSLICFGAGKDLSGKEVISDIAKMPHLLIAGATGSGKSVCINTIIMSILYKASPDKVKFIMIDPKVVELSIYNGIPHLLIPVVSDPKKAAGALNWAVREMNIRYQKFAEISVRDLNGYNKKIINNVDENLPDSKPLPQIVVIVDELADLMMVSSSEVEESIIRLAQLARAAGIHLIIATQRPSVNVITGLIKANMPSRIAFSVTSGIDSRTILDMNGAEKLLGKGDMLYYPQGLTKPVRVQGAFVSDDEVGNVVEFIKNNNKEQHFDKNLSQEISNQISSGENNVSDNSSNVNQDDDGKDEYFEKAGRIIIEKEKGSIGMLQRQLKIGFNRAARIMDQLTDFGVVGPEEGTKPRKVLMSIEEFENMLREDS